MSSTWVFLQLLSLEVDKQIISKTINKYFKPHLTNKNIQMHAVTFQFLLFNQKVWISNISQIHCKLPTRNQYLNQHWQGAAKTNFEIDCNPRYLSKQIDSFMHFENKMKTKKKCKVCTFCVCRQHDINIDVNLGVFIPKLSIQRKTYRKLLFYEICFRLKGAKESPLSPMTSSNLTHAIHQLLNKTR